MNKVAICLHCNKPFKEHANYKCLFEATRFLPRAQTYGVVMNPAYQPTTSALFIEPDFLFSDTSAVSLEPPRQAIEWECSWCATRNFEPVKDILASRVERLTVTCDHCRNQSSIL